MKSVSIRALALAASLVALTPLAQADSTVVTVNNTPVGQGQLDLMASAFTLKGAKDGPELRKQLTEELVTREAVAQKAEELGLDRTPEMNAALANARRDLLVNAFQADYMEKHPPSETEIRNLYEQQKQEAGNKEYHIRHVLVKTEQEAQQIYNDVKRGRAQLEDVARQRTLDTGSKESGGDIGWQLPVMLVKSVRDTVVDLRKGKISEPVQSQFGWHVIKVEDVRSYSFPPLEKVRSALVVQLQAAAVQRAIADIRSHARVH